MKKGQLVKRIIAFLEVLLLLVGSMPSVGLGVEVEKKTFISINNVSWFSHSESSPSGAGNWVMELFFEKDSTFSSSKNYSSLKDSEKTNTEILKHKIVYCVEGIAKNPAGVGPNTTTTLAASGLTEEQYKALANVLKNGYPANKGYWYTKGITSYYKQAAATQLAVWCVVSSKGISPDWNGGMKITDYTSTDDNLYAMAKELYNCGMNIGIDYATPSIDVEAVSCKKTGSNFVYHWKVTPTNCDWGTKLTFSSVPDGAKIQWNAHDVTLTDNSFEHTSRSTSYNVYMTIQAEGNTNKTITLTANPYVPNDDPMTIVYYELTDYGVDSNGNERKYQDLVGGIHGSELNSISDSDSLTSSVYGGQISFAKWNEAHEALNGAVFGIYTDEACTMPATVYEDDILSKIKTNGWKVDMGEKSYGVMSGYLTSGTYYVKELMAPDGYVCSVEVQECTITPGKRTSSQWINTKPGGWISITKKDTEGNILGAGATFGIYTDSACKVPATVYKDPGLTNVLADGYKITTWKNGIAESYYLKEGTYYIKELSAPAGYMLSNNDIKSVTVPRDTTVYLEFSNPPKGGWISVTKKDTSGTILGEGAVFGIYTDSACKNPAVVYKNQTLTTEITDGYRITTGKNGVAESYYLKPGTYYVKELVAPAGYSLSGEIKSAKVQLDSIVYLEFKNPPRGGWISVTKTDESGNSLAGAEFGIYTDNACKIPATVYQDKALTTVMTDGYRIKTGKNGVAESWYLKEGTYYVKELAAPPGYVISGEVKSAVVPLDNTVYFTFKNYPKGGWISVTKKDDDGNLLAGAEFGIYTDKACKTPAIVYKNQTMTTELANGYRITTGSNGVAESWYLKEGTYYVREITAPPGYILSTEVKSALVPKDTTVHFEFTNRPKGSWISVTKKDLSGKTLGAGAVFGIYTDKACTVPAAVYKDKSMATEMPDGYRITTGKNGVAESWYLNAGTYYVKELVAPTGYQLANGIKTVNVPIDTTVYLEFKNSPKGGWISITKKDEAGNVLQGAEFGIYTDSACTIPATVYKNQSLTTELENGYRITTGKNGVAESYYLNAGIYYVKEITPPPGYALNNEVKSAEVPLDTTVYFEYTNRPKGSWISVTKKDTFGKTLGAGAVFGIYMDISCTIPATVYNDKTLSAVRPGGHRITTGKNGIAESWYLAAGTYYIKELAAPSGYTLSNEVKRADIPLDTIVYFEFKNAPKGGWISVTKKDTAGKTLGEGAVFGIYTDIKCTKPATVYNEKTLETVRTDGYRITTGKNGIAESWYLAEGTYYVKELVAPTGYFLSEKVQSAEVSLDTTVFIEFNNPPKGGWISVTKKDNSGKVLGAGAVFGIYVDRLCTKPAKVYKDKSLTMELEDGYRISTGKNGVAESWYLAEGTYYVKELAAPTGYFVSEDIQTVVVPVDTTVYVDFKNAPKGGWISVTKKDTAGNTLGEGAVFGIYTDDACKIPAVVYQNKSMTKELENGYRIITGKNGVAESYYLREGTYYVKELAAPAGYTLTGEIQSASVPVGSTVYFEFRNPPKGGWISVTKKDTSGKTLGAGAVFGIYTDSACSTPATVYQDKALTTERPDGYRIKTGKNGVAESWYLAHGMYYVKELEAPEGYFLSDKVQSAEVPLDTTVYFAFENAPKGGWISVMKKDDSGKTLGKGAVFGIYTDSKCSKPAVVYQDKAMTTERPDGYRIVTGKNGVAESWYLAEGTYYVKELAAPLGYVLSNEIQTVDIPLDTSVSVTFVNYPTRYLFEKKDSLGISLSGCEFGVYDESGKEIDRWITDDTGIHEITGILVVGQTYTLKEISVPKYYEIAEDSTFTVTDTLDTVTVTTINQKLQGSVKVVKTDAQNKPVPGVLVALFSSTGSGTDTVMFNGREWYLYGMLETGENGIALWEGLEPGAEWMAAEISTASGLTLLNEPVYIGLIPWKAVVSPDESYGELSSEADGACELYDITVGITNHSVFNMPFTGKADFGTTSVLTVAGLLFAAKLLSKKERKERT